MTNCGGLDPVQRTYSLVLGNSTAMVTISSNPKNTILSTKPDGILAGPGPIKLRYTLTPCCGTILMRR